MSGKLISLIAAAIVAIGVVWYGVDKCVLQNDFQNFQITQSLRGEVDLHTRGGYYTAFFPEVWTYPKKVSVFFSNEADESQDNDAIKIRFKNKGTGNVSCNITYNLYTDKETIMKMHEYFAADMDKLDMKVLAKLRNIMQDCASGVNSSDVVEEEARKPFIEKIKTAVVNNQELKEIGIEIEQIDITEIKFDDTTLKLFEAQQKADLEKKSAEAEKDRAVMEKERVIANAEKEYAEAEGKAKVELAKEQTDAEKKKKLAEIEAEQKVAVEELKAKEEIVKANKEAEIAKIEKEKEITMAELSKKEAVAMADKEREVAVIQLETEKINLEKVKVIAEQEVAEAEAKKQKIEKAGDMTEKEKMTLTMQMQMLEKVAEHIGAALGRVQLPKVVTMNVSGKDVGANVTDATASIKEFFDFLKIDKALNIAKQAETVK